MWGRSERKARGGRWSAYRRHRMGRFLPAVFLGLSLVVSGWGALEAYRAQRSHAETARVVLSDYGEFAAWSYERRMDDILGSALIPAFSLMRQNRAFLSGTLTEAAMAAFLNDGDRESKCACAGGLAGRFAFYGRLGHVPLEPMWAGEPPAAPDRQRLVEAVWRHVREVYTREWPYAVLYPPRGAPVAFFRLMPMAYRSGELRASGDTLVFGFAVDRTKLAALMDRAMEDDALLPPSLTRGRANRDVVQVQVVDPAGTVLYASHADEEQAYSAEQPLPLMLGGGVARASVLPDAAEGLVIGGLPSDHTAMLLVVFSLAAVLAVAAIVQLRREHRLALLRQDFVASVSHELRTPLAQIRLFTETLRLGRVRDDAERGWAITNISRETLRLMQLVERILHFSRAERGIQPVEGETVDLAEEVADAVAAFTPLVAPTRARFVCDVPAGLTAEVNRDSLRQVLLNYLDNAVRYGPAGQTVRVVGAADGPSVRLAVEDEGPGVPLKERNAIFDPFQRGERTVGTVASGSGIGLSVVRQIAEAFAGRAWVEDAPGGGARFVFELPVQHTARPVHFHGDRQDVPDGDTGTREGSEVA